jgi:hypothetical protein
MKRMALGIAAGVVLVASGFAVGKSDTQRFGKIECESITVRSPDGRYTLSIAATNQVAGVWIEDNKAHTLTTIYNMEGQGPVVGIHKGKSFDGGFTAALAIDGDGRGFIQDSVGGKWDGFSLHEVARTKLPRR